jgi:hypothetical protein
MLGLRLSRERGNQLTCGQIIEIRFVSTLGVQMMTEEGNVSEDSRELFKASWGRNQLQRHFELAMEATQA